MNRVFKNTEFYGGGKTSENSLNEPAELSLRCLAKTENDHCAAPCDTGVGDVGVPVEGIGYQMTLSSARALWGCALGGPARGRPALHDTWSRSCSGNPKQNSSLKTFVLGQWGSQVCVGPAQ